jgi:light-regulated signal transduction histidine kinase (bacteriophytochrome)
MDWDLTTRSHWGFSPDQEIKQEMILSRILPEDRAGFWEAIGATRERGDISRVELRIFHPDNTIHHLLSVGRALKDTTGRTVRIIGTSMDITEQKTAESALKQYAQELKSFSYSVTHDLKNPLRTIIGFATILEEDYAKMLDDDGRAIIKTILQNGDKMSMLIDDILKLSKVSKADLQIEEVDLSSLAESVFSDLRKVEPQRQVTTRVQPGCKGRGDKRLLNVVLTNLIGNSWKYTTKTDNPCIEFGCERQNGETVYFVRDNGSGFDMAHVNKLFLPFSRLHAEKDYPGTGVGLATVARIINRHNGKVHAKGEIGKGATFYFTLGT